MIEMDSIQTNIREQIEDVKDLLGLYIYSPEGNFEGMIKAVENRQRFFYRNEWEKQNITEWTPFEFWYVQGQKTEKWYGWGDVHIMTNGDYIRRNKEDGLIWAIGQGVKYALDKGYKNFKEWAEAPYIGDFLILKPQDEVHSENS